MKESPRPHETEAIIQLLQAYYESLFPKTCPSCDRQFATLGDYVQQTSKLGSSHSYDAEEGDWEPSTPVGSTAMSNCPCGSTLSLNTDDMALDKRHRVLNWIQAEVEARDIEPTELLDEVRAEIRKRAVLPPIATCRNA